jgi:hypothetical protein
MHKMPIIGKAIRAGVLAHRRDNNPVAQQHIANLQFVE